jgi:hypothetical protein
VGRCSLTVTDRVVFSGAQGFETALITFSEWRRLDDGSLLVNDGDSGVNIAVKAAGSEFRIDSGEIHEDLPSKKYPVRLGITLTQPVTEAEIILTITPASPEK